MERYNLITGHKLYQTAIKSTDECECGRIYCLHGFAHALDVARIAYILALESKSDLKKDIIYAAAFLHDTGRFAQYKGICPHDEESSRIASKILPECGYTETETEEICNAILSHRSNTDNTSELALLICKADKLSRDCPRCAARSTCYWSDDEKNSCVVI